MKVIRPTKNPVTRGYLNIHRGYDFAGLNLPDEVRAGIAGEIIERVDKYNSNWSNTGTLTTADYGNYIKIRHDDGSFELHAHLKQGSSLSVGTRVSAGQVVARIGNTGNSTGPHLHSEYRTAGNVNIEVEFVDVTSSPPISNMDTQKASQLDRIKDFLKSVGYTLSDNPAEYAGNDAVLKAVLQVHTDLTSNKGRAGKWDQECLKAGFQGDSNQVTVDQLFEKIKSMGSGVDKEKIKRIKAELDTL